MFRLFVLLSLINIIVSGGLVFAALLGAGHDPGGLLLLFGIPFLVSVVTIIWVLMRRKQNMADDQWLWLPLLLALIVFVPLLLLIWGVVGYLGLIASTIDLIVSLLILYVILRLFFKRSF